MSDSIQADIRTLLDSQAPIDIDAWGRVCAYLAENHADILRSFHASSGPFEARIRAAVRALGARL